MRRFNDLGLENFKAFVKDAPHTEEGLAAVVATLDDPAFTDPMPGATGDLPDAPATRFEMATAVVRALGARNVADCLDDNGFMCWLSVRFHLVTFYGPECKFAVGSEARHIFTDGATVAGVHDLRHRHLVRSAVQLAFERGAHAEGMLSNHPSKPSRIEENVVSRKSEEFAFMRTNEFFKLFNLLFVADRGGRKATRRGIRNPFERLIVVGSQLDATFDLGSMRCDEMLRLLPSEFDEWKPARAA